MRAVCKFAFSMTTMSFLWSVLSYQARWMIWLFGYLINNQFNIKGIIILERQMKKEKILTQLSKIDYPPDKIINLKSLQNCLQTLISRNTDLDQYPSTTIHELWQNTPKIKQDFILVDDLATTILQADSILLHELTLLQDELKSCSGRLRKNKLLQLYSIYEEYKLVTRPFKIEYIELACYDEVVELIPEEIKNRNNYIFATEPNLETSGLKIVLWIAMISLGLEIIMMFHKNHFYTLLTLCSVLSIFFLNYFDSTFIKIVIANLLLSSVLDMIWEITNARNYWEEEGFSLTSGLQSHFLKFIAIFVVLVAVGKLMMLAILFKYRNNVVEAKKNIEFLSLRFNLDGDPSNNPISQMFLQ